jgi:hypothetical protein
LSLSIVALLHRDPASTETSPDSCRYLRRDNSVGLFNQIIYWVQCNSTFTVAGTARRLTPGGEGLQSCSYFAVERLYFLHFSLAIYNLYTVSGGNVDGTATRYGMDGPGIGFLVGTRFYAFVQTSPGAHPASYKTGTLSVSRGQSGQGVALTNHST